MARKPPAATPPKPFSDAEKRSALGRLEARVKELRELDLSKTFDGDAEAVATLEGKIRSTLANIFGEDSAEFNRLRVASHLDTTSYTVSFNGSETPPYEIQQGLERGRSRAIATLQGEVDALREDIEYSAQVRASSNPTEAKTPAPLSKEIFIVHGRDDAAKVEVARLVERAGLEATILHEQANGGRTIIEKFEKHGGSAGFAIVVMTPDDVGGLDPGSLQPRARQNVIGEMFWFAGRLGRERVCALKKGAIEVPTDFAGVGYVDMDSSGTWKKDVLRELEHAGYKDLDWQKALA